RRRNGRNGFLSAHANTANSRLPASNRRQAVFLCLLSKHRLQHDRFGLILNRHVSCAGVGTKEVRWGKLSHSRQLPLADRETSVSGRRRRSFTIAGGAFSNYLAPGGSSPFPPIAAVASRSVASIRLPTRTTSMAEPRLRF